MYHLFLAVLLLVHATTATSECEILQLVESIPDNLTFTPPAANTPTTSAWLRIMDLTQQQLDIAEFYFDLRPSPPPGDGSDSDGQTIYRTLHDKGLSLKSKGGRIRVAQNVPNREFPDTDSKQLAEDGAIELKYVDFKKLIGTGILHTKMIISDEKHFYLGSANMDWQSLRQVKELGIVGINCPVLAQDLQKIFEVYWYLTEHPVPDVFPAQFQTQYNMANHMQLSVQQSSNSTVDMFVIASPPQFCPTSRTTGIEGLLHVINSAEKYIHIEVMEYFPALIYIYPEKYWPVIDEALRSAMFDRGVQLRMLTGLMPHNHTRPDEFHYLKSLAALDGSGPKGRVVSQLKLFIVPSYTPAQAALNYARVNHAKFMITDKHLYVSTSNWSGDYFTSTGGISFVISATNPDCDICKGMRDVFDRDWGSTYSHPLTPWHDANDIQDMIHKYQHVMPVEF